MGLDEILKILKNNDVIQGKVETEGIKVEVIFKAEPFQFPEPQPTEGLTHDEKVALQRKKEEELLFHSSSY